MKKRTIFLLLIASGMMLLLFQINTKPKETIPIGILHSLSGTMKISEKSVADVTLAAFKEINDDGGILNHTITAILSDGKSDPQHFGAEAQKLIDQHHVKAIFGCWNSSSRKEVKTVVEARNNLLFYPVQYEGFEQSPNILYLGQTPNQQIRPAIKYAIDHFGKKFYLVGSDYIFPRAANLYVKDISQILNYSILGESYVKLGDQDFKSIVEKIKASAPDVIFNTLNGDSNIAFFRELQAQGINAETIPVISFSIADAEIQAMGNLLGAEALAGHYASWSYFSTIDSEENDKFKAFLKRHNISTPPTDAMEAAYNGVQLYKQAIEECGSFDPETVRRCLPYQSYKGAGGIIYVDGKNNHTWKNSRIAQINADLKFTILVDSTTPTEPEAYPAYRSKQEWNLLMYQYHPLTKR